MAILMVATVFLVLIFNSATQIENLKYLHFIHISVLSINQCEELFVCVSHVFLCNSASYSELHEFKKNLIYYAVKMLIFNFHFLRLLSFTFLFLVLYFILILLNLIKIPIRVSMQNFLTV